MQVSAAALGSDRARRREPPLSELSSQSTSMKVFFTVYPPERHGESATGLLALHAAGDGGIDASSPSLSTNAQSDEESASVLTASLPSPFLSDSMPMPGNLSLTASTEQQDRVT